MHKLISFWYQACLFLSTILVGNVALVGQSTDPLLGLEEYLAAVVNNHPASLRAALLRSEAAAVRMLAGGDFDPILYTDYDYKNFKGSNYWRVGESGLLLPTLGGLELAGGYRWATGEYINEEQTLPARGQAFVGLKANLLQGLLTDERRTALQRARLLGQWNELEIAAIRNDLTYDASQAYINWAYRQLQKDIIVAGLALAADRLVQTRTGFQAGELPALDTLETFIILQQRQAELAEVEADLVAARTLANQFLWNSNTRLEDLRPDSRPLTTTALGMHPSFHATGSIANNPDLAAYDFKLQDLELERRLKAQKQLPKLSFKYELLAEVFDFTPSVAADQATTVGDLLLQDNKFSINFTLPIFMRSARGELQLNQIKQAQTQLDRQQKAGELSLKLAQYEAQIRLLQDQVSIAAAMVGNYETLLAAERIKFDLGESSVFLLNTREGKLLEAQLKVAKLEADLAKARASRRYILGGPPQ